MWFINRLSEIILITFILYFILHNFFLFVYQKSILKLLLFNQRIFHLLKLMNRTLSFTLLLTYPAILLGNPRIINIKLVKVKVQIFFSNTVLNLFLSDHPVDVLIGSIPGFSLVLNVPLGISIVIQFIFYYQLGSVYILLSSCVLYKFVLYIIHFPCWI